MAYILDATGPDPDMAGFDGPSGETINKYPETDRESAATYCYLSFRGLRIPELLAPKKLIIEPASTQVLDVIAFGKKIGTNNIVRDTIERIAPGQAEFIPFEVEFVDGSIKEYYFMNVLRHIACLCWNTGNVFDRGRTPNGMRNVGLPPAWGDPLDITIKRIAHSGVHIWHEEDAGKLSSWIFISYELGQALRESGATGMKLTPVKVV